MGLYFAKEKYICTNVSKKSMEEALMTPEKDEPERGMETAKEGGLPMAEIFFITALGIYFISLFLTWWFNR